MTRNDTAPLGGVAKEGGRPVGSACDATKRVYQTRAGYPNLTLLEVRALRGVTAEHRSHRASSNSEPGLRAGSRSRIRPASRSTGRARAHLTTLGRLTGGRPGEAAAQEAAPLNCQGMAGVSATPGEGARDGD